MKKSINDLDDELRPEYDLTKLKNRVRGKYAAAYAEGTNLILIEPDLADAFPTAASVNDALRSVLHTRSNATMAEVPK